MEGPSKWVPSKRDSDGPTHSGLHSYPCDVLGKNVGHFGPKPTSGFVMTTLIDETYSFHS